ncbi:tRNA (guanosine(46)-N7)-methyltransferase TrmB [Buchnera aphidicola (Ceratovacuna keduensis)]|uniref:tRNA (guanosine(46)-N7)-methyltransferase TrmB n=1 Tax=Buchnera aphidicola TaxID=9 RepID=UPI0031B83AD1
MKINKNLKKINILNKNILFREVKSFVLRRKKISNINIKIIKKFWKQFCIEFSYIRKKYIFKNNLNPIILDIGFGNGKKLCFDVIKNSKINFLGIEVYINGILHCIKECKKYNIKNLKIIYFDALKVLKYMLLDNSIFKIQIFFPDPWKKKRHNKRRLINLMFLSLVRLKLIKNGILHIMTDCKSYYIYIIKNIEIINCFKNFFFIEDKYKNFNKKNNINTKYENIAKNKKKVIYNIIYKKI